MKARVGDRLVKDGGDSHRVCEIIGLHHADGSPPYVVRWLSDGHIALLYPGPYMRLVRQQDGPPASGPAPGEATGEAGATQQTASTEAASGPAGDGAAPAQAAQGRPAASRARTGRAPAAGRRWVPNPFAPVAAWPSRGTT